MSRLTSGVNAALAKNLSKNNMPIFYIICI